MNLPLWEKDVKLMRSLSPSFAKIYPIYWKNELVLTKGRSKFDREQDSLKHLQRFLRDFNLVFMLQAANLATFNRLWESALLQEVDIVGEQGHTFRFSCLISFILHSSHTFFPQHGLAELAEKIEFSKGTETIKA